MNYATSTRVIVPAPALSETVRELVAALPIVIFFNAVRDIVRARKSAR